jgi:CRISPR system Cascade subunit CasC
MTNTYIDINVIQTVPSSNINRDDTGAPKTAIYGGVTRSRVSSQAWKHAMREYLKDVPNNVTGWRTKDAASKLAEAIQAQDNTISEEDAVAKAEEVFAAGGVKVKKHQTDALLLISQGQIKKLAEYAVNNEELDKKELKPIFNGEQSLDLALFGRMVASNPELNTEASAQVAHAISTHEIVPEFDYFTAKDDLQAEDNAGASMLGTIEYNSSTLYRYANVNFQELSDNLGNADAVTGALSFIKSFILSMPTGKQNTFANKTLPSYVMIAIRPDTPVNLVSAFEKPVKSNEGYVEKSIDALEAEYKKAQHFVDEPELTVVLTNDQTTLDNQVDSTTDLLNQVGEYLKKVAENEDNND